MKKGVKRHYKKRSSFVKPILFFAALFCLVLFLMACLDSKVFDTVIEISHMQSKNIANNIIDSAIKTTIADMNVSSSDFFSDNKANTVNSISANTILINDFCTSVSNEISKGLEIVSDEKIKIPIGVTTGIDFFANMGPEIPFSLRPAGSADVDYETGFESVGINQTNFKIWINVSIAVQIVNPMRKEKMTLNRKVMLVDTVISGEVPKSYLKFGQ